jgi:hypothetical protein
MARTGPRLDPLEGMHFCSRGPDCVAGVGGLELTNPYETYVFEMSR